MTPGHATQQLVARVRLARSLGMAARRRRVPRARLPLLIESDYAGRLVGIIDRMRSASGRLVTALPALLRTDAATLRLDDSKAQRARRTVEHVREEIGQAFNPTQFEALADSFGQRVSAHQRAELVRQGRAALGVDVVLLDPKVPTVIDGFVHENVALIKSLQGRTLDQLEALITRAVSSGTRAEVVAAEIAERFDIAERHARLIARDQIARLNSQIAMTRHAELGISRFYWRSMRDPRVRPQHQVLDNDQPYSYAEPPAEGFPGNCRTRAGIGCRCYPDPVFDDLLAAADEAA